MKLIMSPASPFARKARVLIREADLTDSVEEVEVSTNTLSPNPTALSANPLGKIPSLVRSDAPALIDSRVICRFLDDHAGANLYPASSLWEMLTLEALADGLMESAVLMVYEARLRPETEQSPAWVEAQWARTSRAFAAIENNWMSYLTGRLNIGQIGVGCALSYLDLRHDDRNWRDGRGKLAKWHAEFSDRASMQGTKPV